MEYGPAAISPTDDCVWAFSVGGRRYHRRRLALTVAEPRRDGRLEVRSPRASSAASYASRTIAAQASPSASPSAITIASLPSMTSFARVSARSSSSESG